MDFEKILATATNEQLQYYVDNFNALTDYQKSAVALELFKRFPQQLYALYERAHAE